MTVSFDMVAIALILAFMCLFFIIWWGRPNYPYFKREALLTKAELRFYQTLRKAHPSGASCMMKVRLNDIINCSDKNWAKGYGPKISSKHIDFVLIDTKTTAILLCIELDDRSHEKADRRARDVFVNKALEAAHVPLMRVTASNTYNFNDIKTEINAYLGT